MWPDQEVLRFIILFKMSKKEQLKIYTSEDISNLVKNEKRAIVTFEGKVYDTTEFKCSHPGGGKIIDEYIGKDITKVFNEEEHTKVARRMFVDMLLGVVENGSGDQDSQETHNDSYEDSDIEDDEWREKVDPTKGTVWQVYQNLTEEEYIKFINNPKHLIKPNDVHRMFHYSFIEFFSRTPWYHVFLFWTPIASFK